MNNYRQICAAGAAFLERHANRGEVLVIASVRDAADDLVRSVGRNALIGVHRFAWRDFVHEAASTAADAAALTPVRRIVREALAAKITAEALHAAELDYVLPVAKFPGFARALAATIEELRLNGVTPAALGQSDLGVLLARYGRELSIRLLADHAARVELAIEAIRSGDHRFARMPVLLLETSLRTTRELQLVEALRQTSPELLHLQTVPSPEPASNSLGSLQAHLFADMPAPLRPVDESFSIFSASGEALECVEIARRILQAEAPFDTIAILLRSPERYQPLMTEALRRAEIPFHLANGAARPDTSGRAFLALLRCAEEGLSASRFAEYMSLGQAPAPAAWERMLVDAAVIGGKDRWEKRLAGLRAEWHHRYRAAEDDAQRQTAAERIAGLERLSEFALPIVGALAALPPSARWGDWIEALRQVAALALEDPQNVHELLDELTPMSDIGPVDISDVLRMLSARLTTLRPQSSEYRYGKVFVGGIEDARGIGFRLVFVPGLNEGVFPRTPFDDPLLSEERRLELGMGEPRDEAELLRIAVSCAAERITFSFSRLDLLTGRERVPSFYAFEAWRAGGGGDTDVPEFEARAREGTETRIGWPAPSDPAVAIDNAEFDLSMLAPRMPGCAAYLKEVDGRAIHSLRARWQRWRPKWSRGDGVVDLDIEALQVLEKYKPTKHPYSPSALQQYARCPYRFFLRGVYHLHPVERPASIQRLDPGTRGELFHRIQFELLSEAPEARAEDLQELSQRLNTIINRVAAEAEQLFAPAIAEIWQSEIDSLRADLQGWLQHRATVEFDWLPQRWEWSFGLKAAEGHDPRSIERPVTLPDGFLLCGSIDLVERHSSGVLRVTDHKTGAMPEGKLQCVGGGELLQPGLYGMAAEKLSGETVASGRLFYSTLRQNYRAVEIPLKDHARQRTLAVLRVIERALHNGFLPAAPRKDGCRRCEYLPVCGPYEEERVAIKLQPELHELKQVRQWP